MTIDATQFQQNVGHYLSLAAKGENPDLVLQSCLDINTKFESVALQDFKFITRLSQPLRKSLKANDCLVMAIAVRKRASLMTFDKRLLKAADSFI